MKPIEINPLQPILVPLSLNINGKAYAFEVDTRTTLLDVLREKIGLTGTKKGCDHGHCGTCTLLADGMRINACLSFAVMHAGSIIRTIEGIGTPEHLHPIQAAFIRHDAFQCGYCTSGQICSAIGALDEMARGIPSHATSDLCAPILPNEAEIKERLSGNLCRCGAYANIYEAMVEVVGDRS